MKKVTSITMHTTSEGQRLSYTYSEINEDNGSVISDNNRESMVVLDIPANKDVLDEIAGIKAYVTAKMEG